jgi:hypothetical protein
MKVFKYEYWEEWGEGQGIVIAETQEEAIQMMREPYSKDKTVEQLFPHLTFEEVDITEPHVMDFSWCE